MPITFYRPIPRPPKTMSTTSHSPVPRPSTAMQPMGNQYLTHLTAINDQHPTTHQEAMTNLL